MSPNRRSDRLVIWVCSIAVLVGSAVLLGWLAVGAVDHVTADDQPATITDISGPDSRSMTGNNRDGRTVSFRLEDGSEHAAATESRWSWWPDEGDTIHVHETSPGDWAVSEDFSWLRTLGSSALVLLPWLVALLKAWEWVERTARPERWEARQREERARRRLARKRRQR